MALLNTRKSTTQARGRTRRSALLEAARELLQTRDLDTISLADVAKHAGVAKGSAYYFYRDIHDLYMELAQAIGLELQDSLKNSLEGPYKTWPEIVSACIDAGCAYYAANPAARQLLVGPKSPPEIKRTDRANDIDLSKVFESQMDKYFVLPDVPERSEIFFRAIEIADLMFSLSVMESGEITEAMADEAMKATTAYLSLYIPQSLPKRSGPS